ncbi:MAG: tetratricopeptide repeat protein [Bacteroidetes bacterium]|nr:tetratricopeptide repeat protein [Bacteroidota bacterium]
MRSLPAGRAPASDMADGEKIVPRFGVRAAELLARGDVAAALSFCLGGTKKFPEYATGFLLLGRCYEKLGRPLEAATQYQRVDQLVPGLACVAEALRRLSGGDASPEPGAAGPGETSIDFMLRQLQMAKPRKGIAAPAAMLNEDAAHSFPPETPPDRPGREGSTPHFTTVTLAEIYAQQGEYRAAVEAYRTLIQQRPDDAGRYRERLEALERLLQGVDKLGEA